MKAYSRVTAEPPSALKPVLAQIACNFCVVPMEKKWIVLEGACETEFPITENSALGRLEKAALFIPPLD